MATKNPIGRRLGDEAEALIAALGAKLNLKAPQVIRLAIAKLAESEGVTIER